MATDPILWYNETLGMYPFMPSLEELIQRNLSTLRHALQMMDQAYLSTTRGMWKTHAESLIKEHNRLVRANRQQLEVCR